MKDFVLIRFFDNEKYAKEFLDGNISMNFLGAYWGPDSDRLNEEKELNHFDKKPITPAKYGQDDRYEGTILLLEKDSDIIPEEIRQRCIGNVILRIEEYRYCNLLCMCAVDFDQELNKINLPDTDYFKEHFGKYVVLIRDTEEFIRRLDSQLMQTGYDYVYGRVKYNDLLGDDTLTSRHSLQMESNIQTDGLAEAIKKGKIIDVFDKDQLLNKQKEWRLCLYRGIKEESRVSLPSLGSLRDISQMCDTDNLNTELLHLFPGYTYSMLQPDGDPSYKGNISRNDLQTKICSDGQYKILFNIG